jgi:hypothetical protein
MVRFWVNTMKKQYESWGRYPKAIQSVKAITWADEVVGSFDELKSKTILPFGNGRSYGDSCLNSNGSLLDVGMNRLMDFDIERGVLRCEAGILLSEIIDIVLPLGWFLSVTPGTKYITIGGAIANDVHGKNHHRVGSFGNHLIKFELVRSDGAVMLCSKHDNPDWFHATVGGLGLTGIITWAEIQLMRIPGAMLDVDVIKFKCLSDFFRLSELYNDEYEYIVSWIDCLSTGSALGRGHMMLANHKVSSFEKKNSSKKISIPFDFPFTMLGYSSVKIFNKIYYNKFLSARIKKDVYFDDFFYPLDGIGHWNRIYGQRGFQQYQCVVPCGSSEIALAEILMEISAMKMGSFLAVLKKFGNIKSVGLMSFCKPGFTLALDFNNCIGLDVLFKRLDDIVFKYGGRLYPAKDAHMSSTHFQDFYPLWKNMAKYKDPLIISDFWRRVSQN